jgi:hypothetical protein
MQEGENLHSTIFKEKILRQPEKKKKQNPKPIFFYRSKRSPSPPLMFFENKADPPFPWKKTKTDAPAFRPSPSPSSSSLTYYSPQRPGHKPLFPCLSRLRASGHHLLISLYQLQPLRQTSLPQPATIVNTIYRPSLSVNTAPPETALHSFFFLPQLSPARLITFKTRWNQQKPHLSSAAVAESAEAILPSSTNTRNRGEISTSQQATISHFVCNRA